MEEIQDYRYVVGHHREAATGLELKRFIIKGIKPWGRAGDEEQVKGLPLELRFRVSFEAPSVVRQETCTHCGVL